MNDEIGNRMKENYENRSRIFLPRRTYTLIRVDGKAFHTLTRGFKRPFDQDLIDIMDQTAKRLCEEIQGAKLAYVQSDEISILLTDFAQINTSAWFDGNLQKMSSISAAVATAEFNRALQDVASKKNDFDEIGKFVNKDGKSKTAYFDSRVFQIPDPIEVANYFIWRQQDASRNSVQMVARSMYSESECFKKNNQMLQDMIHAKGQNWNDYPVGQRRGRCIVKETYSSPIKRVSKEGIVIEETSVARTRWAVVEPPVFTQEPEFLKQYIPRIGE